MLLVVGYCCDLIMAKINKNVYLFQVRLEWVQGNDRERSTWMMVRICLSRWPHQESGPGGRLQTYQVLRK